jgi:predicted HTH domain antitoxin
MEQPLTTRLPKEMLMSLKELSKIENIDTSTTVRKLLVRAIKDWKIEYALEKYKNGTFSLGKAAEFADISVLEFIESLKAKRVLLNYDNDELSKDIKSALEW